MIEINILLIYCSGTKNYPQIQWLETTVIVFLVNQEFRQGIMGQLVSCLVISGASVGRIESRGQSNLSKGNTHTGGLILPHKRQLDSKDKKQNKRSKQNQRREREHYIAVDDLALKSCTVFSATCIHAGIHKVQPLQCLQVGKQDQSVNREDKVLEAHVEPEILLWSILENVICHHGV